MDINQLRISALRTAMAGLSQKDFANQHGLDASYLSQLLNGHRKLGEKAAATLEEKINLSPGTLVNPERSAESDASEVSQTTDATLIDSRRVMQSLGFITIPHLNVTASMGSGNVPPEHHVEVIKDITVHLDWLKTQGLAFSGIENLAIITGDGDSMDGTFRDGDSLLVDRGITEIRTDAVYVFTLDGDLYIKRLQRMTGGALRMISDNPVYPAIVIEGANLAKVHIQARVLLVWNARKL
ncbi:MULTISPECIES: XRE family transcriptional regulator [Pseudomonas syringae group]|uniref:XRE family transcriptional regulator n=1 Tax=Pseudomonas syringae group TaxID=136849 RepID=UPI00233FC214|nr:LexA family transcriptional regulator [Pseudomonas syringae]MDC3742503.1 helix-turn-helix domain-containing protein [Pseudomonas syringae pv. syringae]MEE4079962.1 LexA family transcriptional regulator [Pseudomonas viridiflava]